MTHQCMDHHQSVIAMQRPKNSELSGWQLSTRENFPDGNCICKLLNLCNLSNQSAIAAIRLQSQQSDCNPSALQLDYTDWFELQNRTAILYCCGLHLDYTERKIQSLGNIWKVLAHGVHQAVRFTWVWLLQDYLKIASNCFGLLGLHLDC